MFIWDFARVLTLVSCLQSEIRIAFVDILSVHKMVLMGYISAVEKWWVRVWKSNE